MLCLGSWSTATKSKGLHQDWLPSIFQLHHEGDLWWWLLIPDVSSAGLSGPQFSSMELQGEAVTAQPHTHCGAAWPKGGAASSLEVPAEGKCLWDVKLCDRMILNSPLHTTVWFRARNLCKITITFVVDIHFQKIYLIIIFLSILAIND